MNIETSHEQHLYRMRSRRRMTPAEYDTAVRRINAIDAGASEEWSGERVDRRREIDANWNV